MTMRIRQVKPSFFKDPLMAELSPAVRLFYVGLWMIADDAGWFRWDVAEVGNELYGYEPRTRRERNAATYLDVLVSKGRVDRHPCGHISIPTLVDHQRLAGLTKQVRTVFKEHEKECIPNIPADPRNSPETPDTERNGIGTERERDGVNGTVRNGSVKVGAQPRADEGPRDETEFSKLVPRDVALGRIS